VDELAAVPSNEHQPYLDVEPVTDDEFEAWVKRSQADTDAVLADWDDGVEFHAVESIEASEAEVEDAPLHGDDEVWDEVPVFSPIRGRVPRRRPDPRFQLTVREASNVEADRQLLGLMAVSVFRASFVPPDLPPIAGATLTFSMLDEAAQFFHRPETAFECAQARQLLEAEGFVVLERRAQPMTTLWTPPEDPMIEAVRRQYGL
jgi:hypothetical protein